MSNYKVKVNNEAESREVQELFFALGGVWSQSKNTSYITDPMTYIYFNGSYVYYGHDDENDEHWFSCESSGKELTIPQLKDLVVLKRNSIDDATHEDYQRNVWFVSGDDKYMMQDSAWELRGDAPLLLKPIIKHLKEYLTPQDNGKYALTKATEKRVSDWVEVPDGMNFAHKDEFNIHFTKLEMGYRDSIIVWQRHTQPEELPFIDDKPKSLNDTYAEIEQVRQDNVNNPSHYSDSSIECIDAIEAMMTPEQFIGYLRGNVFKYQWRYEKKNGIEDLKKAQWYLDKLVTKVNEK